MIDTPGEAATTAGVVSGTGLLGWIWWHISKRLTTKEESAAMERSLEKQIVAVQADLDETKEREHQCRHEQQQQRTADRASTEAHLISISQRLDRVLELVAGGSK